MKKVRMLLLSLAVLFGSGCALMDKVAPAPEPQEVIKEMITNMNDVKSGAFDISSKIYKEDKDVETSIDADVKLTAKTEEIEGDIPNVTFSLDLTLDTNDAEKGEMKGNVKMNSTITDGSFYFKLDDLTLPEELQAQVSGFVDMYKGNWYKLPDELMPPEVKEELVKSYSDDTKKEKLRALLKEAKLFEVLESSEADGQYVYKTQIDQEGLKNLSKEIAKLEDEVVTDEDLAMLDEFFTKHNHTITLHINKDSRYLDRIEATINAKEATEKFDISFTMNFTDHNKAQNITAPEDAQDFNPMSLMGLGMMLEGSQGTSLNGDVEGMEGLDMSELEGMDMEELEESMKMMEEELEGLEVEVDAMDLEAITE